MNSFACLVFVLRMTVAAVAAVMLASVAAALVVYPLSFLLVAEVVELLGAMALITVAWYATSFFMEWAATPFEKEREGRG